MALVDLEFERVSKQYRIPAAENAAPRGLAGRLRRRSGTQNAFFAVRDLSFEVPHGQALGIIGHNGAGKSTILKLLSGITTPSQGVIRTCGRIAALLEVGSGFHPELTGRENIFLSGSILGMSRREIHRKLDSIVEFAEIRNFIDVPVKRYSSGMYVRLGFSIAAHLEPDILLLDEVLAVGDANFQKKSKQRIMELKAASTTIIFISHDLHAVEQVCDRVLVVRQGCLVYDGDPQSAATAYQMPQGSAPSLAGESGSNKIVTIEGLQLLNENGSPPRSIATGDPVRIRVNFTVHAPITKGVVSVLLHSPDWQVHCAFTTMDGSLLELSEGLGTVEFSCGELGLQPGLYLLDAVIWRDDQVENLAEIKNCSVIQVTGGSIPRYGTFYHPHTWTLLPTDSGLQAIDPELVGMRR